LGFTSSLGQSNVAAASITVAQAFEDKTLDEDLDFCDGVRKDELFVLPPLSRLMGVDIL
jgi:hypothetical protein